MEEVTAIKERGSPLPGTRKEYKREKRNDRGEGPLSSSPWWQKGGTPDAHPHAISLAANSSASALPPTLLLLHQPLCSSELPRGWRRDSWPVLSPPPPTEEQEKPGRQLWEESRAWSLMASWAGEALVNPAGWEKTGGGIGPEVTGSSPGHPCGDLSSKGRVGPCSASPEHYFPSAPTGRGVMRWPC